MTYDISAFHKMPQTPNTKGCGVRLCRVSENDIKYHLVKKQPQYKKSDKSPTELIIKEEVIDDGNGRVAHDEEYTEVLTLTVEDLSTLGFDIIEDKVSETVSVVDDENTYIKDLVMKAEPGTVQNSNISKKKNRYKCVLCMKYFLHNFVWKRHLHKFHGTILSFSCHLCSWQVKDERRVMFSPLTAYSMISSHIRSHALSRTHRCLSCGISFSSGTFLRGHTKWTCLKTKKTFRRTCSKCFKLFTNMFAWVRHRYVNSHGPTGQMRMRNIKMIRKCEDMSNVNMSHPVLTAGRSKIYPMTYSGSQSKEIVNLTRNQEVQLLGTPLTYNCALCETKFDNCHDLQTHILEHKENAPSCCQICGRTFCTLMEYQDHMKLHAMMPLFTCTICAQEFKSEKKLKRHYSFHLSQKHKCVDCNQTFAVQKHLKDHRRQEHIKETYMCMECGLIFKRKTFLHQHEIREHSVNRHKFICPICGHPWRYDHHVREHIGICTKQFTQKEMDIRDMGSTDVQPAKCHTCREIFASITDLVSHITQHRSFEKSFTCKLCPLGFSSREDLSTHQMEHRSKPVLCAQCFEMFSDEESLKDHACIEYSNNSQESKPHCCDICLKAFVTRSGLHKHSRVKHGMEIQRIYPKRRAENKNQIKGSLKCLYCPERFFTSQQFQRHIVRSHKKSRLLYVCDWCPMRFDTHALLQFHLVQVHTDLKLYRCSTCEMAFDSLQVLKQHLSSHPTGEERNQCECSFCGRRCPYPSILERHMRSHDNKKTETCMECGKSFRDKHTLFYHQALHKEQRGYVCQICTKGFRSRASLYTHMQTHSESRPKCDICQKTFSTKYTLREHMIVHTRDYSRVCVICGRGFAYESMYESHILEHVARGEGEIKSDREVPLAMEGTDILTSRDGNNMLNEEDLSKTMENDDSVVCVLSLQDSAMSYEKIVITNGVEKDAVLPRGSTNVENMPNVNLEYDLLDLTAI